jgi:hypothetical protein
MVQGFLRPLHSRSLAPRTARIRHFRTSSVLLVSTALGALIAGSAPFAATSPTIP